MISGAVVSFRSPIGGDGKCAEMKLPISEFAVIDLEALVPPAIAYCDVATIWRNG